LLFGSQKVSEGKRSVFKVRDLKMVELSVFVLDPEVIPLVFQGPKSVKMVVLSFNCCELILLFLRHLKDLETRKHISLSLSELLARGPEFVNLIIGSSVLILVSDVLVND
jgi:hypothetical protein